MKQEIKYPINVTFRNTCKDGQVIFKFEEDGRFKLDVEVVNCCPGLAGGFTVQHPNDRVEPNPAGPGEQHALEKGDTYTSTFDATKGQKVNLFCRDVITKKDSCIYKYSIQKV